jgi:hypothetical protein
MIDLAQPSAFPSAIPKRQSKTRTKIDKQTDPGEKMIKSKNGGYLRNETVLQATKHSEPAREFNAPASRVAS